MKAQVRSEIMTKPKLPDWLIPPPEGFTSDDLDHFPDLPAHTELLDGSLVLVSPQAAYHMLMMSLIEQSLRESAPDDMRVRREMSVVLNRKQRPEPDIIVIRATADLRPDVTAYQAADVLLAIEVVSPESEIRDRERKPQLYAEAGIPHHWRIERDGPHPVAHIFELDSTTGAYAPKGVYHGEFKLDLPFPIHIDLREIENL
jgi:Uma2 family endonuclease